MKGEGERWGEKQQIEVRHIDSVQIHDKEGDKKGWLLDDKGMEGGMEGNRWGVVGR